MKLKALLILLFAARLSASAQYQVNVTSGTYADLTGAYVLSFVTPDSGYYFAANFDFPTFARTASFKQQSNPPSLGGFVSQKGYLAVYESPGYQNTIVFQCLYQNGFRTVPGITKVSAKIEGGSGNSILKCEWKDLVKDNNTTQRINFQVWLHEADGKISYHYGPNTFASRAASAYSGIVVINQNFTAVLEGYHLEGNPASPAVYTGITTFAWPTFDSIPEEGSVITLSRSTTGLNETALQTSSGFYPNPASENVSFTGENEVGAVTISDISGRIIRVETVQEDRSISTAGLKEGIYILSYMTGEHSFQQRLVIRGN
jgi:hypothetical protein